MMAKACPTEMIISGTICRKRLSRLSTLQKRGWMSPATSAISAMKIGSMASGCASRFQPHARFGDRAAFAPDAMS